MTGTQFIGNIALGGRGGKGGEGGNNSGDGNDGGGGGGHAGHGGAAYGGGASITNGAIFTMTTSLFEGNKAGGGDGGNGGGRRNWFNGRLITKPIR